MSRLDALLGTNVIAKTEFATHGGKLGTVMEGAKGSSMGEKGVAPLIQHEAQRGNDTTAIAMDDPVLQSCLNKLQVIDVIAGQLDRHADNYFVQQDAQGKVTGIKGIDLDMAFGAQMKTAKHHEYQAFNYLGMAKLVDADLGARILKITDAQIRAALDGLLTPEEVDATVDRFDLVRQHVQQLAGPNGAGLTAAWTPATAHASLEAGSDPFIQKSLGARELAYRVEWAGQDADKVVKKCMDALVGKPGAQHDPAFKPDPVQWNRLTAAPLIVRESFVFGGNDGPGYALVPSMWAGEITPAQALTAAAELVTEVIRGDLDDIALFAQANPAGTDSSLRTKRVAAAYKARAARAAGWVKASSAPLPQLPAAPVKRGTRARKRGAGRKQLVKL
jgi:hypothetical protein